MIKANYDFNKTLEQYVFEIASSFIEPAGAATQSSFIDLFNRIDSAAKPSKVSDNQSYTITTQQLEQEWQQVLNEPVNWGSIHRQWRIGILQQRLKNNETYMVNLRSAVLAALQQYRYTQRSNIREPNRSYLLDRHKRTVIMFRRHLVQIHGFQAVNEKQLNQLQNQ